MTATILPPDVLEKLNPELFIPIVLYLCHEGWGRPLCHFGSL
jgi:hypothetical protein